MEHTQLFAAALAHEIRNPISIVKANIDLLELSDIDRRYENNYRIMRAELDRMCDTLRDFIAERSPLAGIREVSLNALLSSLVSSLDGFAAGASEIVCEVDGEISLRCDAEKLRRALLNLLKNSVEALPRGGGRVNVSARRLGKAVEIIIADNGAGMTESELERIKKPYFTTKTNGSGLGLHIARNIIREHSGRLSMTSEKGKGCAVRISLPRAARERRPRPGIFHSFRLF